MNDFDIKGIQEFKRQLKKSEYANSSSHTHPRRGETRDEIGFVPESRTEDEPLSFSSRKQVAGGQKTSAPSAVPFPEITGKHIFKAIRRDAPSDAPIVENSPSLKNPADILIPVFDEESLPVDKIYGAASFEDAVIAASSLAETHEKNQTPDSAVSTTAIFRISEISSFNSTVSSDSIVFGYGIDAARCDLWNKNGTKSPLLLIAECSSFLLSDFSDDVVLGEGYDPDRYAPASKDAADGRLPAVEKIWFSRVLEKVLVPRFYAVLVLTLLLLGPLLALKYYGEFCYISDEGEALPTQRVVWTAANSPREIAGGVVDLKEEDRVDVEEFGSTKILTVVRSYPVTLTVDGVTETYHVLGDSVANFLGKLGVSLSKDDLLSHDHTHILREKDEIVIWRVTYRQRKAVEDVPYKTIVKNSPVLSEGSENLAQTGIDSVAERVYRDKYIDGELVSFEIIEETILEEGREEIIVIGDPTVPASTIDGSLYTDIAIVDGAPTEYERVMDDAICTAYSGSPGTFGASGMRLFQGFVAVNPDVIPYGTLMYIASDRFVYGWAIAGDCGTAMMEGYVDIDCYFETYNESAMFGKKLLNVYIIRQLTQGELEEYAANGMFYDRVPESVPSEG